MFDGAAGAAATTAVCVELALLEPTEFVPVTTTRKVKPTSAATAVYDCELAPAMSLQLLPDESQRRHWYAYEIGCVPDHVPGSADSTCPACAVPLIVGSAVLLGATGAGATTAVGSELALLEPALFVAVTTTRIVKPTSAASAVYVFDVAPLMLPQLLPLVSHRCH